MGTVPKNTLFRKCVFWNCPHYTPIEKTAL